MLEKKNIFEKRKDIILNIINFNLILINNNKLTNNFTTQKKKLKKINRLVTIRDKIRGDAFGYRQPPTNTISVHIPHYKYSK